MVPRLRSLSQFEFTVVYGVRAHPKFIDLHENVQLFRFNLLKRLFFSPLYILAFFVID